MHSLLATAILTAFTGQLLATAPVRWPGTKPAPEAKPAPTTKRSSATKPAPVEKPAPTTKPTTPAAPAPAKPVDLPMPPPPKPAATPPPAVEPAPLPPATTTKKASPEPRNQQRLWVNARVGPGMSAANGPSTFRGAAQVGISFLSLGPNLQIELVAPLSVAYGNYLYSSFGATTTTVWGLELMPGLRLVASELLPKLRAYADAGAGALLYRATLWLPIYGNPGGGTIGFGARLGLGLEYDLLDSVSLVLEPIGLMVGLSPTIAYPVGGSTMAVNPGSGVQLMAWLGATYRL